jgi:hypothetical protein
VSDKHADALKRAGKVNVCCIYKIWYRIIINACFDALEASSRVALVVSSYACDRPIANAIGAVLVLLFSLWVARLRLVVLFRPFALPILLVCSTLCGC